MILRFPPTRFDAIVNLVGNNKHFSLSPEGKLEWLEENDDGKPTESEIDAELIRYNAEFDALSWKRSRQAEYPAMGDQLDYIFHNGVAKWKTDMIEPVKTKYPKPS